MFDPKGSVVNAQFNSRVEPRSRRGTIRKTRRQKTRAESVRYTSDISSNKKLNYQKGLTVGEKRPANRKTERDGAGRWALRGGAELGAGGGKRGWWNARRDRAGHRPDLKTTKNRANLEHYAG